MRNENIELLVGLGSFIFFLAIIMTIATESRWLFAGLMYFILACILIINKEKQ